MGGLPSRSRGLRLLCGEREEYLLEAHAEWSQLQRPPAAGDDRPCEVAADVTASFPLYLEADDPVVLVGLDDPGHAADAVKGTADVSPARVDLDVHRFRPPQARGEVVRGVD